MQNETKFYKYAFYILVTLIASVIFIYYVAENIKEEMHEIDLRIQKEKIEKEKLDGEPGVYRNCVFPEKNKIEIVKIRVYQDLSNKNYSEKYMFIDLDGKSYPMKILFDINDIYFAADLSNHVTAFINYDFKNYACILRKYDGDKEKMHKVGFMSNGYKLSDLGDWKFSKFMQKINKQIDKQKLTSKAGKEKK